MKILFISLVTVMCSLTVFCQSKNVKGRVFEDLNVNGIYDKGEPLLKGVVVSNGRDIVTTNLKGEYSITRISDNLVFIIKPSNYQSPLTTDNKVSFYIPYDNNMSIDTYDFPLYKNNEDNNVEIVLLGDLQVDVMDDIYHVEKLVISELSKNPPDLIFPLGDLVFDNLDIFEPLSKSLGLIGSPIYYVIGNHDLNFGSDLSLDKRDLSFKKVFGPSYYALEYGNELILVLNNIIPTNEKEYIGGIDKDQREFIQNILNHFYKKYSKVKVMMHIPIDFMNNREEFLNLFKDYDDVFVGVGHTHTQYHEYFKRDNRKDIHQLVAGAVCGSWWQGPHDVEGIPFSMMYDGTLKGYWFLKTQSDSYNLSYKVSSRDKDKQIQIWVPEVKDWDKSLEFLNDDYIYSNVFAADANTDVQLSFDGLNWLQMEYYEGVDPNYNRLVELQKQGRFKNLKISPIVDANLKSKHLWRTPIPDKLGKGPFLVKVKVVDSRYGLNHVENQVMWNIK